jgi:hypothetical protein
MIEQIRTLVRFYEQKLACADYLDESRHGSTLLA